MRFGPCKRAGTAAVCLAALVLLAACRPAPTAAPAPTTDPDLPAITAVEPVSEAAVKYRMLEWAVALEAEYENPFDAREVRLQAVFTAPDGESIEVAGFWDGEESWRLRFTPWAAGQWAYAFTVADANGSSSPTAGTLAVADSDRLGWILPGDRVDPAYSSRYFAHHDGTPFYGIGHGEALNILTGGFDIEDGVRLFDTMKAAGENYVVWWPLYTFTPLQGAYDRYHAGNMDLIDTIVADAEKEEIYIVFTIWHHLALRDTTHAWPDGRWSTNGFNQLGDLEIFFTGAEAWAWQENFYRYTIARWGSSPAIALWQTVSEIDGTNAYGHTDRWHAAVNAYFSEHDPYRHPTTASMSGDIDWPAGFAAAQAPQVHLYDFEEDVVAGAAVIARWTQRMWAAESKPNWIGEYGIGGYLFYPELLHNANWAALAAGAAMTPAEWNGGNLWWYMTDEMYADMARFAAFAARLPLVRIDPSPLELSVSAEGLRAWGLAGADGGMIWVQDHLLEGLPIREVRTSWTTRTGVEVSAAGLAAGSYTITPYETWTGLFREPIAVDCTGGAPCLIPLPAFTADLALLIERE